MKRAVLASVLAVVVTALPIAACHEVEAPTDEGVCWRMHQGPGAAASFTPVARDVDGLETCAVLLEAVRLGGQPTVDGAYQGSFIFVDATGIRSAQSLGGFHYPIFQPPQVATIDHDLKEILKSHS